MKERINTFIESLGISVSEFERLCGLANGAVSKMGDNTRMSTLDKISNVYPQLNMVWLRTGNGEMLKDGQTLQNVNKSTIVGGNVRGNGNNISNNDDLKGMIELQKGYQNMLIKSQSQIDTLIQQNKEQFDRMMSVIEKFSK